MRCKRNRRGYLSRSTIADAKSGSSELIPIDRQRKNIADSALGLDHARCIRINLQLAPQPQDLNIDAAIEDIFMNSCCTQEMLARKRSLLAAQVIPKAGLSGQIEPILSPHVSKQGVYVCFTRERVSPAVVDAFSRALKQFKQTEAYGAILVKTALLRWALQALSFEKRQLVCSS